MNTYIIYNSGNSLSVRLHKDAVASCTNVGLVPTLVDGVTSSTAMPYLNNKKLYINSLEHGMSNGTLACFCSHHMIWELAAKNEVPTLILEHDGIVVRDPRPLLPDIHDVCHLDAFLPFNSNIPDSSSEYFTEYNAKVSSVDTPGVCNYPSNRFYSDKNINKSCFRGAYGYIITKQGATKILEFVNAHGAFPADKCLCSAAALLQRSCATYVRLHSIFNTLEKQRSLSTRNT